jgi:hypothetical protein
MSGTRVRLDRLRQRQVPFPASQVPFPASDDPHIPDADSANKRLMHCSKIELYSMNSSARARCVGGTAIPSAFAVPRFTKSSKLFGCPIGRSLGLAPVAMRAMGSVRDNAFVL